MDAKDAIEETVAVPAWDLPVRLVHWLVAALVAFSWLSAEQGWIAWHKWSGAAVLCLVIFRIYWGLVGGTTARFGHFVRGPRAVLRHAGGFFSRSQDEAVGHNPLGGWNVLAMLTMMLLQAGLGLFSTDEYGMEGGPLARLISFDAGRRVATLHEAAFNLLLTLIALHVAAVIFHLVVKRENLVGPMLSGVKRLRLAAPPRFDFAAAWRAPVGLAACAIVFVILMFAL